MRVCSECGKPLEYVPLAGSAATCPECTANAATGDESGWLDVARVTNLAEAGFLADDLAAEGMTARIYQSDEFSGMRGSWGTQFLIQVPAESAHAAAARIRYHLADDQARRDHGSDGYSLADDERAFDPVYWRPVALIALVGVASFVLGQQLSEQRPDRRPPRDNLSSAVEAIGRPLVTEPVPGQPRYRLTYDRRHEAWQLDMDTNGDGRYDRRRRFHSSGAAW